MNANDGLGLWMLVLGFGETEGRAVLLIFGCGFLVIRFYLQFAVRKMQAWALVKYIRDAVVRRCLLRD